MFLDKIIKEIKDSNTILLGLGAKLYRTDDLPLDCTSWSQIKLYNSVDWEYNEKNSKIIKLLKDKDFFIITTSWDSHLDDEIPSDRLFTPNGNCRKLHCYKSCTTDLWDYSDFEKSDEAPICPHCASSLIMNLTTDAYFIKDKYDDEENRYYKWLHNNYNSKLLIIEIESDELDRRLIIEPFENIATALPNAKLIRINSGNISIPSSISRSEKINISPEDFFRSI